MGFARYLALVRRWWWLIGLTVVVTASATFALSARQEPFYEASGTVVVLPRSTDSEETFRAINTLSRGAEINSTFVSIAESSVVRRRARDAVEGMEGSVDVTAEVLSGTNVIEIRATAAEPEEVTEYVRALIAETIAYTDDLDDVFQLLPLDEPRVPNRPAGPDTARTNALGVALGGLLGGALALIAELVLGDGDAPPAFELYDPDSHAFRDAYFGYRLDQELARSARTGHPFSVGVLRLTTEGDTPGRDVLRRFVRLANQAVRRDEVLAHLADGVFAVLITDADRTFASERVDEICERVQTELSAVEVATVVVPFGDVELAGPVTVATLLETI